MRTLRLRQLKALRILGLALAGKNSAKLRRVLRMRMRAESNAQARGEQCARASSVACINTFICCLPATVGCLYQELLQERTRQSSDVEMACASSPNPPQLKRLGEVADRGVLRMRMRAESNAQARGESFLSLDQSKVLKILPPQCRASKQGWRHWKNFFGPSFTLEKKSTAHLQNNLQLSAELKVEQIVQHFKTSLCYWPTSLTKTRPG
eukprot:s2_g60.t1